MELSTQMTIVNLHQASTRKVPDLSNLTGSEISIATTANALDHPNPTTQLLLISKVMMHRPEAGLNPLVDAAASVFSVMGRLKHLKTPPDLAELHEELVQEIEHYRETVQVYNHNEQYIAEYIPITSYALCATLDDVIASTAWGGQGKWNEFSLVGAYNQEQLSQKSFFIILERLVRDPAIYIDVMEFMYICLSLGFKCLFNNNAAEFDHEQLEQITNALYKRIRAYRGNFSKILSPFPIRPMQPRQTKTMFNLPMWMVILLGSGLLFGFIVSGKMLLDSVYNRQTQHLTQMVN